MTLLRDFPGFQTKGHVGVMYLVGVRGAADPKSFDYFMKFSKDLIALPIKATALHFCYDNPVMKPIMTVVKIAGGKDYRVRSRVHYGKRRLDMKGRLMFRQLSTTDDLLPRLTFSFIFLRIFDI